jgi:hypothetical protein
MNPASEHTIARGVAEEVRAAVQALNQALDKASVTGLKVELSTQEIVRFGDVAPQLLLTAEIFKVV